MYMEKGGYSSLMSLVFHVSEEKNGVEDFR